MTRTCLSSVGSIVRWSCGSVVAAAMVLLMSWSGVLPSQAATTDCKGGAVGITLPDGFCATIFADNIGHARQMAFGPDGTLYVNTWSGIYYNNGTVPAGGFVVALKDKDGNGRADVTERFGETVASGGHGGTGIAFHNGMVYAEINDRIVRYPLAQNEIAPKGPGQTVVSGLPTTGDHPMHPFLITPKRDLFVDLGSATNDCEQQNRFPHSRGHDPCTEKKLAPASGAMTRTGPTSVSRRRNDTPLDCATEKGSRLTPPTVSSLHSTGGTSFTRIGRSFIPRSRVRICRLKSSSNCGKARTTAGRNAISTTNRENWCLDQSTAATEARRSASAPSDRDRWRRFRDIGRPMI